MRRSMSETALIRRGRPYLTKILQKGAGQSPLVLADFAKNYLVYVAIDLLSKPHKMDISHIDVDIFKGMEPAKVAMDMTPTEFFSRELAGRAGVVEVKTWKKNGEIGVSVTIQQPDWNVEEGIYKAYSKLLDVFPDKSFRLSINELFGEREE